MNKYAYFNKNVLGKYYVSILRNLLFVLIIMSHSYILYCIIWKLSIRNVIFIHKYCSIL